MNQQFAQDVRKGLSAYPKYLSSKYFYDKKGDSIFQEIMHMPEYYLTDCEFEILDTYKQKIVEATGLHTFDLVELGAGDGLKTKILLNSWIESNIDFTYYPIDISGNAIQSLEEDLKKTLPALKVEGIQGEYTKGLKQVHQLSENSMLVLFLGSNIGNFSRVEAADFLQHLREVMELGDFLLIGYDLKKDPATILEAYNDPAGITSSFNLNLLERINRELGGHFQADQFQHWESYHPVSGEAQSFLISLQDQKVRIDALDMEVHFEAWEAFQVERSCKYHISEMIDLAAHSGFELATTFQDKKNYFANSLFKTI
jgi:L-histidine N-alpha-methyltransferase